MVPPVQPVARPRGRDLAVGAVLLLVIGGWLAYHWPARGFWYDETVNAYFAQRPWSEIWDWCTRIDNQMPLHFILLKLWGSAAGTSEFALRMFSALCTLLAATGVFALGRRLGRSLSAGVLAALAFALTQSFLYAAFEVRPYGLALALYAWASVFVWELGEHYVARTAQLDRRYVGVLDTYLLLALGVLYTHYTGFVALAAHGVYLIARALPHLTRRKLVIGVQLAAGIGLGYLPWIAALAGRDVRARTAYAGHVAPRRALHAYVDFYADGQKFIPHDAPPYALALLLLILAALLLWGILQRRNRATRPGMIFALLLTLLPVTALALMVYGVQAKLSGRHAWPAWIGAALVIGLGLSALRRLPPALSVTVWVTALAVIWLPASAHFQPTYNSYLREAFGYVSAHAEAGDVLVLRDGTLFTAAGYYDAHIPWIGLPSDRLTDVTRFLSLDETVTGLEQLIETHAAQRVWVLAWQGHIMDPQNLVEGMLEAIGTRQPLPGAYGFGDVTLSLFTLHDRPRSFYQRVMALYPVAQIPPGGPLYLGGYMLNEGSVPRGGLIELQTWWQRGPRIAPEARVSLRLYTPNGTFFAQLDQPPVTDAFGQADWPPGTPILGRAVLWVPTDAPSGPADVVLVLYSVGSLAKPVMVRLGSVEIVDWTASNDQAQRVMLAGPDASPTAAH